MPVHITNSSVSDEVPCALESLTYDARGGIGRTMRINISGICHDWTALPAKPSSETTKAINRKLNHAASRKFSPPIQHSASSTRRFRPTLPPKHDVVFIVAASFYHSTTKGCLQPISLLLQHCNSPLGGYQRSSDSDVSLVVDFPIDDFQALFDPDLKNKQSRLLART